MARKLQLVPTAERLSEDDIIGLFRSGEKQSISNLERRSGLSRGQLRGMEKKYAPAEKIKIQGPKGEKQVWIRPAPPELPPEPQSSVLFQRAHAWAMMGIALTLAGVGIALNYQFARSLGQTPFASQLMGILGIAIDTASVFLLPVAATFWDQRRFGQFLLSVAMWVLCSGLSLIAGMSFSAANIGDSLQSREIVTQHRKALNSELAIIRLEFAGISEQRSVAEIDAELAKQRTGFNWKSSAGCTVITLPDSRRVCDAIMDLEVAKQRAARRFELDGKINEINTQIAALPPIAVKDPGADYMSRLTAGVVDPDSVEGFRVIGFASMPSFAGLLLMFARRVGR
jgi:hypothetical protein